ncbi:hypothetical protein SAMN05421666_1608 [Roseovarius nanhaiticus]|uniref:DUF2256 domain-containing protein n=1 Tax=Roseovarius nanhaiticus TaxID=573024 RepID=A0A1N7G2R1_9RHOB|nr:DUF2256 domain-containing protein [Roseovarius nanhaiticus]SEK38940.1 hypothetical protein SAMN05216208_0528 [Roseovarius nanhaiticus]SIS06825.1 hypothetical protein SAMN05421666_1608 [Roseovarius nanhaiticus]
MKHRKKGDLPTKTCATCGLPFTWRKKWERVWDDVRYCSDKCRRGRGGQGGAQGRGASPK